MAFKTPHGTWRVLARTQGKRISKTFRTKILAQRFEAQLRTEGDLTPLDKPSAPSQKPVTFGEFADRWLRQHSEMEKAVTTQYGDRGVVDLYLKPAFGQKVLAGMTKGDLLELKATLKARLDAGTMKPATANKIVVTAKSIYRTAIRWEVVDRYPWDGIPGFRIPEQPFDYWQPDEVRAFYEGARFIDLELADMVLLAFNTGLRLGELRGLRWSSVDFEARQITVCSSMPTKTTEVVDRTKSGLGRVPLSGSATSLLKRRAGKTFGGLVFDPSHLGSGYICVSFQRLTRRLGLRKIRFHDLRHSFATNLRRQGVAIETVQRLMRHKTLAMTMRYAHVGEDELHLAMAKLTGTDLAPQVPVEITKK